MCTSLVMSLSKVQGDVAHVETYMLSYMVVEQESREFTRVLRLPLHRSLGAAGWRMAGREEG